MQIQPISQGFEMEQIVPFFQPVMDLECRSVLSYECLARQVTTCEQAFLPSEFIQIIEQEQCFGELTRAIFHQSAEYFRNMNTAWSINLSQQDISELALINFLQDYLKFYPFPQRVILEMSAQLVQSCPEEFKAFLLVCKVLDIQLFIDNFTCDVEKMKPLLSLPIDGIKIDGPLICQLNTDQSAIDRVNTFNQLACTKGILVIAQHIENHETLQALEQLGIRYGQGFYLSEPNRKTLN